MRSRCAFLAMLAVLLAACGRREGAREPAPPRRPSVLRDVPRVGRDIVTDTTGSVDAERLTMLVNVPMDSVAAFYRQRLPALGWRVLSDQGDTTQVSLYARRGEASLWVRTRRLGTLATEYTLIAAAGRADTAATPRP